MEKPQIASESTAAPMINGRLVDIDFTNFNSAVSTLDNPDPFRSRLIEAESNQLPTCIDEMSLDAYRGSDSDSPPQFIGRVEFNSKLVQGHENWLDDYMSVVEDRLARDYIVDSLDDGSNALYLSLNDNLAVRLQIVAVHDTYSVEVETMSRDVGNTAVADDNQSIDLSSLVAEMANLLGVSIDTLSETFDSGKDDIRYLMEFNQSKLVARSLGQAAAGEAATPRQPQNEISTPHRSELSLNLLTLSNVGGSFEAKRVLKKTMSAFMGRDAARKYGLSPNDILLYGPSGTDKASLAGAFANEADAILFPIRPSDVMEQWIGQPAKNIKKLIAEAEQLVDSSEKTNQKLVIYIEGVDALIGRQADGSNEIGAKQELLTAMARLRNDRPNIIIIGTTNADLGDLDEAFTKSGSFEAVGVTIPTREERKDIWETIILNERHKFGDTTIEVEVDDDGKVHIKENGFSPYWMLDYYQSGKFADATADMTSFDIEAMLETARGNCAVLYELNPDAAPPRVTNEMVFDVIKNFGR